VSFRLDGVGLERSGRVVLDGLSFELRPGERAVLLGVNGSGKTSLLKLLDGLLPASRGEVRYRDRRLDAAALGEPAFRRRFRSEVGLLFQNVDAMLFHPTVAAEIAFGPRQLALPDAERRAARWAEALGLSAALEQPPWELSGGERKRVALAAVLAVEPRVLLLDEATAGLDPAWSARLVDLLAGLPEVAVLAATHNLTVAEELAPRALLLAPGQPGLLFDGPTAALLADEPLLVRSGLAHRHAHRHGGAEHSHFHVHDGE